MVFPAARHAGAGASACDLPGSRLRISGAFDRDAADVVGERLRGCGADERRMLTCELAGVPGDLPTLDGLARLRLVVGRVGGELHLDGASAPLLGLVGLLGLDEILPIRGSVEAGREPEQREQARGVEEEHDPRDPVVGDVDDLE